MKIGVIGHLGGNCDFTDGQTVKTKALIEGLYDEGYSDLIIADTFYMKRNPLVFVKQLLQVIKKRIRLSFFFRNAVEKYCSQFFV